MAFYYVVTGITLPTHEHIQGCIICPRNEAQLISGDSKKTAILFTGYTISHAICPARDMEL